MYRTFALLCTKEGGFLGSLVVQNLPANAGCSVSVLGSERSLGEGNGSQLQYSCLGNPMDRGTWLAIVHRVTKAIKFYYYFHPFSVI